MEITTIEKIGAILGAVASGTVVIRWVWPKLKRMVSKMLGNAAIYKRLDEITGSLSYVVSELKVNGGHSLKDHLNRIESYVVMTNEIQHARMLDSDQMIFRTDANGNLQWVNRTFARTVQRMPNELTNHGWFNVLVQEEREGMYALWSQAVSEGRELEQRLTFQTPDGGSFPVILRTYRMDDSTGNMIGFLGTITPERDALDVVD